MNTYFHNDFRRKASKSQAKMASCALNIDICHLQLFFGKEKYSVRVTDSTIREYKLNQLPWEEQELLPL